MDIDKLSDKEAARKVFMLMFEYRVIPIMREYWEEKYGEYKKTN